MYLKLITLCLLASSVSFAQATTPSCLERMMDPLLTVPQKEQITKSANPASEKIKIYTQFHREKYQDFATQCRNQEVAQQAESRTSAIASQKKAGVQQQGQAQSNSALLAGATQAATMLMNSGKPKPAANADANATELALLRSQAAAQNANGANAATAAAPAPAAAALAAQNSNTMTYGNNPSAAVNNASTNSESSANDQFVGPPTEEESSKQPTFDPSVVNATIADVKKISPDLPAEEVGKSMETKADGPVEPRIITANSTSASTQLKASKSSLQNVNLNPMHFQQSSALVKPLAASLEKYLTLSKKACTENAERSNMLCLEDTSDGIKAVKMLVDYGGPILGAISAAQKSCSSLNKITSLASMGLAAAKGVCMASKYMCDNTCGAAQKELLNIQKNAKQFAQAFNSDVNLGRMACASTDAASQAKCAAVKQQHPVVTPIITQLDYNLVAEVKPTPGTTPAMVVGCQNHLKDIGLMALNLIGVMKARDSAKECEKQLSVAGGGELSKQQYCEIPANAPTETCKCERDKMAAGCPAALAATLNSSGSDLAGLNIKNGAGVSGFASGATPTTPTSALTGLNGASSNPNGSGYKGRGASSSAGSGGGNSQGADSSAAGGGDSASALDKKDKSSKKWDFGSFGSNEGGGSAGAKGIGKNGGGLGEKDMDALNRKIASEQFAAEVSSSSGKSNWEKVKRMYLFKETSFLNGK